MAKGFFPKNLSRALVKGGRRKPSWQNEPGYKRAAQAEEKAAVERVSQIPITSLAKIQDDNRRAHEETLAKLAAAKAQGKPQVKRLDEDNPRRWAQHEKRKGDPGAPGGSGTGEGTREKPRSSAELKAAIDRAKARRIGEGEQAARAESRKDFAEQFMRGGLQKTTQQQEEEKVGSDAWYKAERAKGQTTLERYNEAKANQPKGYGGVPGRGGAGDPPQMELDARQPGEDERAHRLRMQRETASHIEKSEKVESPFPGAKVQRPEKPYDAKDPGSKKEWDEYQAKVHDETAKDYKAKGEHSEAKFHEQAAAKIRGGKPLGTDPALKGDVNILRMKQAKQMAQVKQPKQPKSSQTGARGGVYYITSGGTKIYLKR